MKIIVSVYLFLMFVSCHKEKTPLNHIKNDIKNDVEITPVNIDNNNLNQLKVGGFYNNEVMNEFPIVFKGYDLGQHRYVTPFDERNENINNHYLKRGFKNITTMYAFQSMRKDTIYHFPLTVKNDETIFGKRFLKNPHLSLKEPVFVYANLYLDKNLGKIIVIDSVR